ncbi:MAG: Flp pilus assembly protein CpaB [Candidatus Thiodiazotropha sp. (ex Monitilora ramsayi)]|nr:Flp pilus assembly protein CpaB [Candidatus Thiodiazotropha sp. (ex Monitilora ramsayi)]
MQIPKATIILLVGALVSGAGAAYFTKTYIEDTVDKHIAKIDAQYEPVSVIVASRDLMPGELLSGATASLRDVPGGFVHKDALRRNDFDSTNGYALAHPVNSGEPILHSHLSRQRGGKFATLIDEGMRALTLRVDDISSVAGMLSPNDKIDVMLTIKEKKKKVTLPLLQDVLVMATGHQTTELYGEEPNKSFSTVTVLLWPKDAAKIIHAQEAGSLTFILRGIDAPGNIENVKVTRSTLLGKKPGSSRRGVHIIIGG